MKVSLSFLREIRIPLLVFLAGATLIANHTLRSHRQAIERQRENIKVQAARVGAQVSGMTQHLMRKNLPRSVDLLMSYASVSPDLELGLVLDKGDVIRHSTRQQWEGVHLGESPLHGLGNLIPGVKLRMESQINLDLKGGNLTALFPFWEKPDSLSKGLLILQYSLDGPNRIALNRTKHEAIAQTFALAAGSLMLWLMLTQWNTSQRLGYVVDQARTLVIRGEPPTPLEGEDELARFSRSFSDASHRIGETEAQLNQLISSIRDVSWFSRNTADAEPFVNSVYSEIWEQSPLELRSRRWGWLREVISEDRRKGIEFIRDLKAGVQPPPIELRLSFGDGRLKWVECKGFFVADPAGQVLAIGGLAANISDRKHIDRQLLEAAEKERMRIGQDLHDDVCQRLAAAQLKGGILESSLSREGLPQAALAAEVAGDLAKATDIVRGFAHGLAPVVLEAEGLYEALSQLASFVETAFGVRCWSTYMALPDSFDPAATTHLYRIAQELATNAARHAAPEGIGISLSVDGKSLTLQVTNDGTPFDGKPVTSPGMGLHAVRKHVDALGGRIEFRPSSSLLGGTTVICRFPVPQKNSLNVS